MSHDRFLPDPFQFIIRSYCHNHEKTVDEQGGSSIYRKIAMVLREITSVHIQLPSVILFMTVAC
jgi:hypothetical protein